MAKKMSYRAVPIERLTSALLPATWVGASMQSPKRVHDARELFDGVPSLRDAKNCVVMAQLHRQGVHRAYSPLSEDRMRLRALVRRREVFEKPLRMHPSELEGLLGRHRPG